MGYTNLGGFVRRGTPIAFDRASNSSGRVFTESLMRLIAIICALVLLGTSCRADDRLLEVSGLWDQAQRAIQKGDYGVSGEYLDALAERSEEIGYTNLEPFALWLLAEKVRHGSELEPDQVAFFDHHARVLGRNSAKIALRLFSIEDGQVANSLRELAHALVSDRVFCADLIFGAIYPLLLATTAGLVLAFLGGLVLELGAVVRPITKRLPNGLRTLVGLCLGLAVIVLPLACGPLWALFVWSSYACYVVPRLRWLAFAAAITIGVWAAGIPIKENSAIQLSRPPIRSALRLTNDHAQPGDIETLSINNAWLDTNPVMQYAYGEALKLRGDFEGALAAFRRAETIWRANASPGAVYALAQQASMLVLLKKTEEAKKLFAEGESGGLNSPEFYLNYSRAHFDLLDTIQSRRYFERAQKISPEAAIAAKEREEKYGLASPRSIAEIHLPLSVAFSLLLEPQPEFATRVANRFVPLMPGVTPLGAGGLVLLLVFVFILTDGKKEGSPRDLPYAWRGVPRVAQVLLRVVPGSAWGAAGRYSTNFFYSALCVLLLLPAIGWPREIAQLGFGFPDMRLVLLGAAIVVLMAFSYLGWQLAPSSKETFAPAETRKR